MSLDTRKKTDYDAINYTNLEGKLIHYLKDFDDHFVESSLVFMGNSWLHYDTSKYFEGVARDVISMYGKHKQKQKAARWFVTNSARALKNGSSGFVMSFQYSYYSDRVRNTQRIGRTHCIGLVHFLEEQGFIDIYKGGFVRNDSGDVYANTSFVVFLDSYYKMWDNICLDKYTFKNKDNVQVRNSEGALRNTRGMAGVREIRQGVDMVNEFSALQEIKFLNKRIGISYSRIFNDRLNLGGRFYMPNGGIQNLPLARRLTEITIDEEPVVEMDFSSTHPNIIYESMVKYEMDRWEVKLKDMLGEGFKPYGIDIGGIVEVDKSLVEQAKKLQGSSYNPLRNIVKVCLLVALNADDEMAAISAVSTEIYKDKSRDVARKNFHGVQGFVDVSKIFKMLVEHNILIEDFFFTGEGLYLMRKDSDIAQQVMTRLGQQGVTAICLHDSFIVAQKNKHLLKQAMEDSWEDVLGTKEFCYVDERQLHT